MPTDVVDDAAELAQLVDVVELADLHDVAAVLERRATCRATAPMNPVALATIACSKLIFEPSAKLVTIAGFWPHFSAKPFCVVGLR